MKLSFNIAHKISLTANFEKNCAMSYFFKINNNFLQISFYYPSYLGQTKAEFLSLPRLSFPLKGQQLGNCNICVTRKILVTNKMK
jgi:hypothetical protein